LYPNGYLNENGGWAESGRVVEKIALKLRDVGVAVHEGKAFDRFIEDGSQVTGIVTTDGKQHDADYVIIAAGAWTTVMLPYLADVIVAVGLPVVHFDPPNADDFRPPAFRPWAADISNTGWYGFPLHPSGVVKIANHGVGIPLDPRDEKVVPKQWIDRARAFVTETFPALTDALIVKTRLCMYCDTFDGDFWIDHDPNRKGLVVATGGSGHGFKFAPVLGSVIADVVEKKPNPFASRFAWREKTDVKTEAARSSS
jgi:glycine/D-amino acid oxidase-like deaminating enzyme